MQGRGKMQVVLVIVLSDVLFFLLENNHKYSFFTPDNKVVQQVLQYNLHYFKILTWRKMCLMLNVLFFYFTIQYLL